MRIAVTSQNFRTVTGHAGRARRFIVFDAQPGAEPAECARLDLATDKSLHECGTAPSSPEKIDVILSAGFSQHFADAMARQGIQAAQTDKLDPAEAVRDFLHRAASGTLLPIAGCDCGGGCHGGDDEHHHEAA